MERCKEYFIAKNAHFLIERIHEFADSSATVELAAARFNCKPAEIAKSLSFLQKKAMSKAEAKAHQKVLLEMRKQQAENGGSADGGSDSATSTPAGSPTSALLDSNVILIVAAGDAKVNSKKYKEKFLGQPKMLKRDEVEPLIGFPPGGVCPFGVNENVKVYLDVSLKRFETVYPAVGTANTGIPMSTDELEKYASNVVEWVDLCEGWQDGEENKETTSDNDKNNGSSTKEKKAENEAAKATEASA